VVLCGCGQHGPGAGSAEAPVVTFANDKTAFDYFLGKGLTGAQAAGIVGNLDQESGMDPTAIQSGGPGRGTAQWSAGGRWDTDSGDNATSYASMQGQDVWSLPLQLDFIWYELTTFPSYGLAALQQSTNVTDATIAFETDFEGGGTCNESQRIAYAQSVLSAYGNDQVDGGSVPDAGGVPCFVPSLHQSGVCILTSDCAMLAGHVSTPGFCPGAQDIQCCTGPSAASDFSLVLSPASGTVQAGSSTTFDANTTLSGGSAESVALTASGLPSGVTANFNPSSITDNGGSSTLTITTASTAAAGTFSFTVNGTAGSGSHAAGGSLTVTTGQGGGNLLANSGFESGLASWTVVKGKVSTESSTVESGSSAAQVGSASPFSGYSVLQQSVALPATGTTTLRFWGNFHCNDTLPHDWQSVRILNASGTTLKTLFSVCSNAGTWVETVADLTPYDGQTVTIRFIDRDDGNAGDPTWWDVDEVSVTNP
jgi:hypothetical protein